MKEAHSHTLLLAACDPDGSIWVEKAIQLLKGYTIRQCRSLADLMIELVEQPAALILMDGVQWVAAVKTEQATRRVPLLVIAEDAALETPAFRAGADAFLTVGELEQHLAERVRKYQRRITPEQAEELACQCEEELPPLAQLGVEKFNIGAYYEQHDAFEAQWMQEAGPVRDLYRAVLQVGVAYYHITRGNYTGALKMLRRSMQWLVILPDVCQGINVRELREDAAEVREMLEAGEPILALKPLKRVK